MEKVYCRDCKYAQTFFGSVVYCSNVTDYSKYNQQARVSNRVSLSENENGTCEYYEPSIGKKLRDILRRREP